MSTRRAPHKDFGTKAQQWMVLIGIPIGLAVLGWFASTFDGVRTDVIALKTTLGFVEQDVGRHTTQLDVIQKQLAKRR